LIKCIIFDLDGTLLNTTEGVLESARHAANQMGYSQLPYEVISRFVGPPIQESFKRYYGCDSATAQKATNIFRDYYKGAALLKASPYEGILKLCAWLVKNNTMLAVATYKREDYALKILEHFGFLKYLDAIHGADNENKLTKADIINMCITEIGCDRNEVVLIGDTEYDAVGAEKAGINFIGVTYGFGFKTLKDVEVYDNIGCANDVNGLYRFF